MTPTFRSHSYSWFWEWLLERPKSMRNQNIIDVHKNYLFIYACLFSSTSWPPLSGLTYTLDFGNGCWRELLTKKWIYMHRNNQEIVDEAFMTIRWCFPPLITTCTNLTRLLYIRHINPPYHRHIYAPSLSIELTTRKLHMPHVTTSLVKYKTLLCGSWL